MELYYGCDGFDRKGRRAVPTSGMLRFSCTVSFCDFFLKVRRRV